MEDTIYFNQCSYIYPDKYITNSVLKTDLFTTKNQWGIDNLKIKFSISPIKIKTNNSIYLSYSDIILFLKKIKNIESKISGIIQNIKSDNTKQLNIVLKFKKKVIITFLYKLEFDGCCVRIILSDSDNNYTDSEKIYCSIDEFLAFISILNNFKDNYHSIITSISNTMMLNEMNNNLLLLNEKISNYYLEFKNIELPQLNYSSSSNEIKVDNDKIIEPGIEVIETSDLSELNSDMTNFLNETIPTIDLELKDSNPSPKIHKTINEKSIFTHNVLKNDISNLEVYIMNIVNDDIPIFKFADVLKSKLSLDIVDICDPSEFNYATYILTIYLKGSLKKFLEDKIELSDSVIPILLNFNNNETFNDIIYDLFLYTIYFSFLKNTLKEKEKSQMTNKSFICFCLKMITSIFYLHIVSIDKDLIKSELCNRLSKYYENGIFSELENEIYNTSNCKFTLNKDMLIKEFERIYTIINQNKEKFVINNSENQFKMLNLKLNLNDFKNNKIQIEQIKKILDLEFNFNQNNKIVFDQISTKDFSDLPITILNKYNISEKKIDITNLKRYIKDVSLNENELKLATDIVSNINNSYRDLKNIKCDYINLSESILKSIYLWDTESDEKISKNYLYFKDLVDKCSLTKDMIISLLLNIQDVKDSDFLDSFKVSRTE